MACALGRNCQGMRIAAPPIRIRPESTVADRSAGEKTAAVGLPNRILRNAPIPAISEAPAGNSGGSFICAYSLSDVRSELSGDAHESVITYPPTITQPCGGINSAIQLPKVARSAHGSLRFLLCGSRYQSLVYADRKRPRTGAKNIDEAAPKGDGEQES